MKNVVKIIPKKEETSRPVEGSFWKHPSMRSPYQLIRIESEYPAQYSMVYIESGVRTSVPGVGSYEETIKGFECLGYATITLNFNE